MRLLRFLPLIAALLAAAPAAAQTVRGVVVEEGTARPVAGATVVLAAAGGATAAGALTDAAGRFSLTAPAPGRYTVRAERVGHAAASVQVELRAGETVEVRLSTAARAFVLPTLQVTADERCVVRPGVGLQAYELWEQAATALRATAVAQEHALVEYTVQTYRRALSVGGSFRPRRDPPRRVTGQPFATLPPAVLSQRGYLAEDGDTLVFYGPDARVLLSGEFMDTHCLYVQPAAGAPGEVGVAFEPVGTGERVEIRGTLWLDAGTGELRSVEYEYTGLPSGSQRSPSGGRLEFQRVPSGAWIVRRWYIRTALILRGPDYRPDTRMGEIIADLREAGGEVTDIQVAGEDGGE